MSKLRALCFFSLAASMMQAQAPAGYQRVEAGEQINETLRLLDSDNKLVSVKVPSDTCMLFYRYRGNAWLTDNRDSVDKVESIIANIQASSPVYKNMRVICYSYNHDNFLKAVNRNSFNS